MSLFLTLAMSGIFGHHGKKQPADPAARNACTSRCGGHHGRQLRYRPIRCTCHHGLEASRPFPALSQRPPRRHFDHRWRFWAILRPPGVTPLQLSDQITTKLRKYIQDPNVSVVINQIHSKVVFLPRRSGKAGDRWR